jgi:hypothetical protein
MTALAVQTPSTSKPATSPSATRDSARSAAVSRMAFHDSMRELWGDHVTYTRNVIISAAADLPDTGVVVQRLLQNQDEIGNAIKPYYGEAAGNQLAALLRSHIQLAGRVLATAKGTSHTMGAAYSGQDDMSAHTMAGMRSGDSTKIRSTDTTQIKSNSQYPTATGRGTDTTRAAATTLPAGRYATTRTSDSTKMQSGAWMQSTDSTTLNAAIAALRANGDSIATFLSSANPRNWSRATLQGAMQMHITLLLQEATTRLKGDWTANLAAFEAGQHQALQMADMLSDGIMKQFPSRFSTKATTMSSLQ